MKKVSFSFLLYFSALIAFAQPTTQQRIEDGVIGWKTLYNFKSKTYKPLAIDGQTFSPYQQSLRDSFIVWMQRSYVPIGGFGDIYQRDFTSRQNKFPMPQCIGMTAGIYGLYKSGRTGKYEMTPNEDHDDVFIYTNTLAGINNAELLSSPGGYYFTMLKDNYASTFINPSVINATKQFGLHNDSRFSKYMVYFLSQGWVTVVLIPGNKLPIVQLTKGEVLALCEKGLQRELEEKKSEARHLSSNDPSYYANVIKDLDEKLYPQCIKNLNTLKEKYKSKQDEPAELYGWAGPSFSEFTSTTSLPTLFIEDWYQAIPGYPVYRYTKEAIENSKKDKPLWIEITWPIQKPGARIKSYEVHKAMLRYFNFDYVYDYFFNPEKVKGVAYTPSNAEEQKEQIQRLRRHYAVTENKTLPQGVFFLDDFSANANGDRPAGWSDSKRNPATVVSLNGKPGKWVQPGKRNTLSPSSSLKKPLPVNFTMEYDVATDEFNARTGGALNLHLSTYATDATGNEKGNEGVTISLTLTSGNEKDYTNNNYSGGAEIKITYASPSISNWHHSEALSYKYDLREFTNKKNSIHVALKVKDGECRLFINNKLVVAPVNFVTDDDKPCTSCSMPAGTTFRNLSFENLTQDWGPSWGDKEPANVYLSNIKITKE